VCEIRAASAFGETRCQAAFPPQPALQLSHLALVGHVIVSQKVQQSMQGQDPQLDRETVAALPSLPFGDATRYHYVSEVVIVTLSLGDGERQDVGRIVLTTVLPIQGAHPRIRDEGHGDITGGPAGGRVRQPAREPGGPRGATPPVDDGDSNHFPELYCS
jgi:hypothetical protein